MKLLFKGSIIATISLLILSPLINFTGLTKQQVNKAVSNQQIIEKDIKKIEEESNFYKKKFYKEKQVELFRHSPRNYEFDNLIKSYSTKSTNLLKNNTYLKDDSAEFIKNNKKVIKENYNKIVNGELLVSDILDNYKKMVVKNSDEYIKVKSLYGIEWLGKDQFTDFENDNNVNKTLSLSEQFEKK
ncbi:hypothetical protein [Mycoplasma sp. HU2014]|uniref:hypothetical protein n=1 Tax=Mycoplasma sp. HU2014 TaxID=1664275 RepID=UPI00067BF75F|nr:hypothetical protein [Mycoplasma sp. HU2014]KNG78971.1 hypothetical protein AB668_05000 [Mycoplasma sp. HU2014]